MIYVEKVVFIFKGRNKGKKAIGSFMDKFKFLDDQTLDKWINSSRDVSLPKFNMNFDGLLMLDGAFQNQLHFSIRFILYDDSYANDQSKEDEREVIRNAVGRKLEYEGNEVSNFMCYRF